VTAEALWEPLDRIPLVLGALREALGELQNRGATGALLVRIDALAAMLPEGGPVPANLRDLAEHLGAFGRFLQRSLATPDALASLAGPTAELCVAWKISAEALAPRSDGPY
jgi:hypothetical protein